MIDSNRFVRFLSEHEKADFWKNCEQPKAEVDDIWSH